jgi:hypothetical protein
MIFDKKLGRFVDSDDPSVLLGCSMSHDANGILADGQSVRVPMTLADAAPGPQTEQTVIDSVNAANAAFWATR